MTVRFRWCASRRIGDTAAIMNHHIPEQCLMATVKELTWSVGAGRAHRLECSCPWSDFETRLKSIKNRWQDGRKFFDRSK